VSLTSLATCQLCASKGKFHQTLAQSTNLEVEAFDGKDSF